MELETRQIPASLLGLTLQKERVRYYVDESGSSKRGGRFIVGILTFKGDEETFTRLCAELEVKSGKRKAKYHKANHPARLDYMQRVFANSAFKSRLAFSVFGADVDQHEATIEAIFRASRWQKYPQETKAIIYVDALTETQRKRYANALRKMGVKSLKIRGVRKEQNNPLIRLVDAVSGFVADSFEHDLCRKMLNSAKRSAAITEL